MRGVDLHQHLWPAPLVELLRRRTRAPYLRDWQLVTGGEPAYEIPPRDHEVAPRIELDHRAGIGLACLSLSAPLGIESLPRGEAGELLDAWHDGARELPGHFAAWASVPAVEPDLTGLSGLLAGSFVGVQLPATSLGTPAGWRPGAGAARGRAQGQAGVHPPRSHAGHGRPAALVGTRRRLRRPAPGSLVGLARLRRSRAVPPAAAGLRGGRGPRPGPPRAADRARRPPRGGRPGRLRRHLVVRRAGSRRADPRAGDRRPGARQRSALRRAVAVPPRGGRDPGDAGRQPLPGARAPPHLGHETADQMEAVA